MLPVKNIISNFLAKFLPAQRYVHEKQMLAVGNLLSRQIRNLQNPALQDVEFSIFSQWGDDGIIQFLINRISVVNPTFIEFGVENYSESNTRFLLMHNNWKGLIIDGSKQNIDHVRNSDLYWKYDLTAVDQFVTRENINSIFTENGFQGPIGLLSIDVDGNDYWIWESINVVDADIVIVEYNSVFGKKRSVTVPYDPGFYRTKAHYSNLYWGASLKAFFLLAKKKGYVFIGCNSNGNNAYFVKKEKSSSLKEISLEEGFVQSRFRESLDIDGNLDFSKGEERIKRIADKEVLDLEQNRNIKVSELIDKIG